MVEGLRSGRWTFRLPSGAALSTHGDYVRGVPHGTWETFWGNEKLRWRYSVVGGRLEGPAEEWAANGMKQSVGTFHEGRRDGEWTFWWSNGTKRASGSYRAGLRQGVWSSWHDNGQQAAIKQYKDDRLVTIIAEWDDWGTALYSRPPKCSVCDRIAESWHVCARCSVTVCDKHIRYANEDAPPLCTGCWR